MLFLGKAEMMFPAQRFTPVDLRRRIFKKIAKDGWRERMAIMYQAAEDDASGTGSNGPMYPAVFDAAPHAADRDRFGWRPGVGQRSGALGSSTFCRAIWDGRSRTSRSRIGRWNCDR